MATESDAWHCCCDDSPYFWCKCLWLLSLKSRKSDSKQYSPLSCASRFWFLKENNQASNRLTCSLWADFLVPSSTRTVNNHRITSISTTIVCLGKIHKNRLSLLHRLLTLQTLQALNLVQGLSTVEVPGLSLSWLLVREAYRLLVLVIDECVFHRLLAICVLETRLRQYLLLPIYEV